MDTNSNNNNNMNRQSESPARTIDSHDSTTGSLDTIVDRSLNREELLKQTLAQSVNTTNEQQQHDSLTNSQISMIQRNNHNNNMNNSDDEHQRQQLQLQQQQQPHQQPQLDAQSHIYSSPVYAVNPEQKPPLKLTAATLLESVVTATKGDATATNGATIKPQLISHEEFQKQLQTNAANANAAAAAAAAASRAATLDSRISKKQRLPPELIKCKDSDQDYASMSKKQEKELKKMQKRNNSPFPMQIALGTIQLVLAISLVALGALLLVRETALSTAGCGIWTGLTAAVTGSLGVVSMRKTQTAFLALSLICIATSTLALAISGVGLSRDIYHMEEQFDLMNANNQISAASGLIFALFLHFVVSVVSVYRCALQMCARAQSNDLNDVIIKRNNSGIALDQEKIEQYFKAMSLSGSEKENTEKLAAMWMYATQIGSLQPTKSSMRKITPPPTRPIMLIPASTGGSSLLTAPPPPPPPMIMAPPMGMQFRGMTIPYMRPPAGSFIYAAHPIASSVHGTYRTHKSTKSADINSQRRRRRAAAAGLPAGKRSSKMDANRRQRSKSEADIVDGQAFTYTGLDRVIADSFLARQEQSNAGSHIDYTSSSSASDTYGVGGGNSSSGGGNRQAASRASSKTKIVCRDVMM